MSEFSAMALTCLGLSAAKISSLTFIILFLSEIEVERLGTNSIIGAMGRRTEKEADKWIGVSDARKRKQIQDRLAQRARRKYLFDLVTLFAFSQLVGERIAQRRAESRIVCRSGSSSTRKALLDTRENLPVIRKKPSETHLCPCLRSECDTPTIDLPLSLDNALLPLPNHTVYSALFHNGVILGISCGTSSVSKSRLAQSHVPEPLRPTQFQLDNVHFTWIDRFPFPEFRDRMILFSDSLNSEDFLGDMFTTTSFTITPGAVSWDPKAWHVGPQFKRKWNYLF